MQPGCVACRVRGDRRRCRTVRSRRSRLRARARPSRRSPASMSARICRNVRFPCVGVGDLRDRCNRRASGRWRLRCDGGTAAGSMIVRHMRPSASRSTMHAGTIIRPPPANGSAPTARGPIARRRGCGADGIVVDRTQCRDGSCGRHDRGDARGHEPARPVEPRRAVGAEVVEQMSRRRATSSVRAASRDGLGARRDVGAASRAGPGDQLGRTGAERSVRDVGRSRPRRPFRRSSGRAGR